MRDARETLALLPPEVIASLAREHLDGFDEAHVAPDIPPRKLRGASEVHALSLQGDPIVVLYDSTLLGGATDGFVATPARLCWKNYFDHPRSARWDELAQVDLVVRGTDIEMGRGVLTAPMTSRAAEQVRTFLQACCRRVVASSAPYRDVARARGPATFADLVIAAARRALGELEWVHYAPSIPPKMIAAARLTHAKHLPARDEVLVLYDETVFGSGNDGLFLTETGVYWRNFWSAAMVLAWSEMDPARVVTEGDLLFVDGDPSDANQRRIDLRMRPGMAHLVAGALREIARESARGWARAPGRGVRVGR